MLQVCAEWVPEAKRGGGGAHLRELRRGAARDLGNAERGQLGLELLKLLLEIGLALIAQLVHTKLHLAICDGGASLCSASAAAAFALASAR